MALPSTGPEEGNHARSVVTPTRLSIIAIVAVVVVALVVVLLPRTNTGPPPSSGASPTAEAPTPTVEPTATPESTPEPVAAWTGLTWSDPVTPTFVVHVHDLVPWGDGYVAVGEVEVDATRSEAAFMTSPDGLNWTVTEQQDPGFDRYPRHLASLGDELLAFSHRATTEGLAIGAPPGSTYYGALIWSSTDGGSTWSLVDSPSWEQAWTDARVGFMPDGWSNMQVPITSGLVDVAAGPDGLVAIGNSYSDDELIPVILHSTDGRAWTKAALPADSPSALLHEVVAYAEGFVLVGSVHAGPQIETATPAAWFSTDGVAWARATVSVVGSLLEGTPGIGDFAGVTVGADGLLGWYGYRDIVIGGPTVWAVWSSADGQTWQPLERDNPAVRFCYGLTPGDGIHMVTLGPVPYPFTGQPWPGANEGWVSIDGSTWTALDMSREIEDMVEGMWVVPDGVIYAGVQSFWFGAAATSP